MTKYFLFFFLLISFLQAPLLGQNLKRKWQTIKAQADTLEAHKDYKAALPLRLQEKDIALKKWKKPSEQYATAAYDLGACYYYLTKPDSALFFFEQSIEVSEQRKDSTIKYIKTLVALARLTQEVSQYNKAALLYEKLAQAAPKILGEESTTYMIVLSNLGAFYQKIGDNEKALSILQRGFLLSEKFLDTIPMLHIRFIANIGVCYQELGRSDKAISLYRRALDLLEKKSMMNTTEYLILTNNLAGAYEVAGKYTLSISLFRQYLNEIKKTKGEVSTEYAMGLQNMGQLYYDIRQFDSSLFVLRETRIILNKIYQHPHIDEAAIKSLIARNYMDMGRLDEALNLIKESLKMIEDLNMKDSYYYFSIQDLLINTYAHLGNYDEALMHVKNGIILKREFAGENLDYARGLSNVSIIYRELGKYDTALIYLRNALEICDKMEGTFYHYGNIYINFANVFRYNNQLDSALRYAQKCIAINEKEDIANSLKNYSEGLSLLAAIYQDKHHFSLAADYLTQNNKLLYQHYQRQSGSFSEKDRKELWSTLQSDYESLQYLCFLAKDSVPQLITQAYNNQLNTGGILLRGTENIAYTIHKSGDNSLIALYSDWCYQKSLITDWATLDSAQRKLGEIDLKVEMDKANEMEQQLAQQSQLFRNATDTMSVQWQQVQASLQQGEAAVEMVQFRAIGKKGATDTVHYAAFILTPETKTAPIYVPLPFGNKMEGEWATEYQNHIEDSVNTLSFGRYFKPILAHIKDAKHIYFAADGIYHKINLNTLLAEDGKYLVEKYVIHRIASTRDLAKRKSAEELPTNQTAALFGNPTFRISKVEHDSLAQKVSKNVLASANLYREIAEDRDEFSNLPAAKEEVMAVKNILEKQHFEVKTYIEKEALEEEVQNLKHPSIILFATHGGFKEESLKYKKMNNGFYNNPMYKSKLYFVGARNAALSKNDSTQAKHEDGILYAAEAALLDLQGTDLVVLSACETGLGTIQNGEGVWGLQRAFRIAGAKNLIMSLWKVDDKASKEFMTTFFENWLEKKMPKYAAFQQAQLSLMKEYPEEPKKWGGFVLLEGL